MLVELCDACGRTIVEKQNKGWIADYPDGERVGKAWSLCAACVRAAFTALVARPWVGQGKKPARRKERAR